jgi:hypothetical protein
LFATGRPARLGLIAAHALRLARWQPASADHKLFERHPPERFQRPGKGQAQLADGRRPIVGESVVADFAWPAPFPQGIRNAAKARRRSSSIESAD